MEQYKQEMIEFLEERLGSIEKPFADESGLYFTYQGNRFYYNHKYNTAYGVDQVTKNTKHTAASSLMNKLLK